ncbi:MAG TPA: tryptophan 2,3-dioxygenase family protein [Longimicrobiales bacterium]|nr:tryptophan 2,3-dioxygenase family protein [Longimicrobiales bacterium]
MSTPVTYATYLRLAELLELQLQDDTEHEHDELLFIVVHQVYELWFKQILHELDRLQTLLDSNDTARVRHTLKRVLTIWKVLVAQIDILETMTPLEFLAFRDRLASGSGFQSHQFRALEFALGIRRRATVEHYPADSPARAWLEQRIARPSIWDSFLHYLARTGHAVPEEQLRRDSTRPIEPSPALQQVLLDIYRRDAAVRELCERFVDLDEGIQEWRYRHVKMVERTIGAKPGTGGSAGAEYLRTTIARPAFPDLWEIRTEL